MGIAIDKDSFHEAEFEAFSRRLESCLRALKQVLRRPGFGEGPTTFGAELELHLIDADGRPAAINDAVLTAAGDGRLVAEIDRFNLEINTLPRALADRPFSCLFDELEQTLGLIRRAALPLGGRPIAIGILPTLLPGDLTSAALTEHCRYRALAAGLNRLRGQSHSFRIEREDCLDVGEHELAYEGANTSFQVHLRVSPGAFAKTYNAAQLAIAPVLAASVNSPLFLGKRLWDETRIALFRHSVEDREHVEGDDAFRPARVSFGHGWAREGAFELFAEAVRQHGPVLPVVTDEDPEGSVLAGKVPELAELRLHQGTIWRWNRAIYDASYGGHLRIEMRALPAGPTLRDMVANAAFMIGLTLGLVPQSDELLLGLTYAHARRNFYEAARNGLDARLLWPVPRPLSPSCLSAVDLIRELLPIARAGLEMSGIDATEAEMWLAIVSERVEARATGASWLRREFGAPSSAGEAQARARSLVLRYADRFEQGMPIHHWR